MLDTLAPTDPILLLAVVDGPFSSLPRDVKVWFGPTKDNRIQLSSPSSSQREAFFDGLLKDVQRPPNQFADGMKRRKRILENLPIAPPIEPRNLWLLNWPVLYPPPHIPPGSRRNGRNLVGIQVNSHLIPGKNSNSDYLPFQVIPGHSGRNPSKKKGCFFSPIPGEFQVNSRSFQVHSR